MRIFLDMDGIVADFVMGAMILHDKSWPYDDRSNLGEEAGWGLERLWGMTPQDFWAPMGYEFWRRLPLTPEAFEIEDVLGDEIRLGNVCFLTSPCQNNGCMDGKREWAKRHFPHIPILFAAASPEGGAGSPKHFLSQPGSLLIDDYGWNTRQWCKAGSGKAFLFPRPWNGAYALEPMATNILKWALENWF